MQNTTARGSRQSMRPTSLLRFMANTQPGGAGVSKNDKKHNILRPVSIQHAIQKLKIVCFFKHTAVLVWLSPAVIAKAKQKRQKITKKMGKKMIQFYRPPPRKMP